MRLKKKPTKPQPKRIRNEVDITHFDNVGELLNFLKESGVPTNAAYITPHWDVVYLIYTSDEDPEDYDRRLGEYELALAEYDRWYAENEEAIEEELDLRAKKNKQKNLAKIERLRKQMEKAEKELARAQQKVEREAERIGI